MNRQYCPTSKKSLSEKETDKNYCAKKQFNLKEALIFYHSGVWRDWTAEELVRFQLFQKRMCIPPEIFKRDLRDSSTVFKRSVFTHELVRDNGKAFLDEYLGTKNPPTLEEILALLLKEKTLFFFTIQDRMSLSAGSYKVVNDQLVPL